MYTYEQKCMMNLGDAYTLLYGFVAGNIIETCGVDGEAAVREATRQFGYDRAETTRAKHLAVNAKINMLNLFTLYHDLPGDPRFRRELQEIKPTERVSHTLVCPMADIWKEYGWMKIGRIYCEEFHPACYSHYAFDQSLVNLSKTLTQEGDEYCDFNVILRPQDVKEELRPICFEEYDPDYQKPDFPEQEVNGKKGFALLSIKLYYYLLKYAQEYLGDAGRDAVRCGLENFADAMAELLKKRAGRDMYEINAVYISENLPLELDSVRDMGIWDSYSAYESRELMQEACSDKMRKLLGI